MAAGSVVALLVAMMLLTGCANTLLTKWQDIQCIHNCDSPNPSDRQNFEQPVLQTVQMFIGESGCWLVVFGFYLYRVIINRNKEAPVLYRPVAQEEDNEDGVRPLSAQEAASPAMKPLVADAENRLPLTGWKVIFLAVPATCDIIGTTLMNAGLLFIAASIYQMVRGALILFVGLFSVIFLKRKLYAYHWLSLFVVVLGVALVGLAGIVSPSTVPEPTPDDAPKDLLKAMVHVARTAVDSDAANAVLRSILGLFLVAIAQIFSATQFVLEEFIMEKYALQPIRVVGWEGLFGLVITVIAQIILHFTVGRSEAGRHGMFDAADGYYQVFHNRVIAISSVLIMFSIGGFNFFGLSVTRSLSATSRSIIDTCRTLFIWIVSLGLGWESFKWLQVVGFALLVYGTFLFNDLVRPPIKSMIVPKQHEGTPEEEVIPGYTEHM